ncbi:MAG: rod shape-determining protein MreD [Rhodobacterales bacterium]|nr:MAG: rod shape-determining protein MreD [Rhodobacterales bacterium]
MIAPVTLNRLAFGALFVLLAVLAIFTRLLPLGDLPGALPPPDFIVLLAYAWVIRRPDFVPATLFVALMLVSDFLFLRPPGVWTAITLLGLEFFRARSGALKEVGFALEMAWVAGVLLIATLTERLLLGLFFVDQGAFLLSLSGYAITVLFYPVVVAASRYGFGLRRLNPGEHVAEVGIR